MKFHTARAVLASLLIFSAVALPAQAVLVKEVAITPYQTVNITVTGFYSGPVAAGINKLLVDGVAADGFCIDPFHFALPSSDGYQFSPLELAPKPPGTMGAAKADMVRRLWGMAYSANMTASQAAGFQIALWEIVGGPNFSLSGFDYGASTLLANLTSYHGPAATLVALTGPGQDYVIRDYRTASVPDSGKTVTLLGISVICVAFLQRRRRFGVI